MDDFDPSSGCVHRKINYIIKHSKNHLSLLQLIAFYEECMKALGHYIRNCHFAYYDIFTEQSQLQMSRLTKYLLMMPLAYMGYCAYQDQYIRHYFSSRLSVRSQGTKELQKRFEKSRSILELLDVFEKSCLYLRDKIDPATYHQRVIDCQIAQTDPTSGLLAPYFTRSLVSLTKYLDVQNKKQGHYSIFFWVNVTARQTLKLGQVQDQIKVIENMLQKRQRKCLEIYAAQAESNSSKFLECVKKTEGAARLVGRQLQRIALIRDFQSIA